MFRLMLLLALLIAAPAAPSRPLDRGPVRTPHRSLDIANPHDEDIVLRNGTIAFISTNYGYFGNVFHLDTGALDDPCAGGWHYWSEFPEGADALYLYQGALWLGAQIEEQGFFTTRVSVGTDGRGNPSINELHAGAYPDHGIVVRSNLPDATDCSGNSIYDPNAQANVEAVAIYTDTLIDDFLVEDDPVDGQHRPLGLKITQTSRLWTAPEFARFVIMDYEIENIGQNYLKNVALGLYMDTDIMARSEVNDTSWANDIAGSLVIDPLLGNLLAWSADADGRSSRDPTGQIVLPDAIGFAGLSEQELFNEGEIVSSFNWWITNGDPNIDFGPAWSEDPQWDCEYGTPEGDEHKFHVLQNRERDYDTYEQTEPTAQADTSFGCGSDGLVHTWCPINTFFSFSDTRFLLSWDNVSIFDYTDGAGHCVYRLNPGERFDFSAAMLIGPDFHDGSGEYNFEGLLESYGRAKMLYDAGYAFQPPSHPQELRAVQALSGQIPLTWEAPAHGDIAGYRVYGRPDSGRGYRTEFTTGLITAPQYTVTGLTNGDYWLMEVDAIDVTGYHSAAARTMARVGAIPNSITLAGHSTGGMNTLSWNACADPTFTHYRIVRLDSTVETVFDNLTGTTLDDGNVISGRHYTYSLYLHNTLGVTSLPSNAVTLTPFSPANRILVYDETKTPVGPDLQRGAIADTLVRNWYTMLLSSLDEDFDYVDLANDASPLTLQALSAHDIVIWHSENWKTGAQINPRNETLREYVTLGGKLLCIGRSSLYARGVNTGTRSSAQDLARLQPLTFDSVFSSPLFNPNSPSLLTRSIGATAVVEDFPSFEFDPVKVAALSYSGQTGFDFLPGVDYFWRNGNTWNLYTVVLQQDDTSGLNNAPCAVIGPGEIYFGFPLYFVPEEQAQEILAAALNALRTQNLDAPKPPVEPLPTSIVLHQNYPNPFNPSTTITFDLPATQTISLQVYNIQGQLVQSLAHGQYAAGTHHVRFDASSIASGLYFYRLEVGSKSVTKKMLLLK